LAVPEVNTKSEHGGDEKDVDVEHGGRARDIEEILQEAVDNCGDESDERSLEQGQQYLGSYELVLLVGDVTGCDDDGSDEWQRRDDGEQPCEWAGGVIVLEQGTSHHGEECSEDDAGPEELGIASLELAEIFVEHSESFALNRLERWL
jgi:hypothetical protein